MQYQTNVVPLFAGLAIDTRPTVAVPAIPLNSIAAARRTLEHLEVTTQLGLRVLDKAPDYSDDEALAGLREVFAALALALAA